MTTQFSPHPAYPEVADRAATVPPIGDSDASLVAWRDAAEAGSLPLPSHSRWRPLRAGVVNLWEFDVAEYWFADGRAQLVGQNQSGKSTLMALTTLIMLAGDLDRQYVDTFGDQQKSFRYYVESTDDLKDRRATDTSTSRGWAWVEYGRLDEDTPVYFTTLLYSQAKRGANDFVKNWAVCGPAARVRDGIILAEGSAVTAIADLKGQVPGFRVAGSGTEYKTWQARELFGFSDTERLDVVVRMLKVLRTPHLGQKLDPDFLTSRMREALPAIDREEIDELAEGWDQLDRLAADKDNAETARKALQTFIRHGWGPWADATIRRYADDLAAATTRLDDVTREDRRAREALGAARSEETETADEHEQVRLNHRDAVVRYDEYLRSAAFSDAVSAVNRIEALTGTAELSQRNAENIAGTLRRAEAARSRRSMVVQQAQVTAEQARQAVESHAGNTRRALAGLALPEAAPAWLDAADTARLLTACRQQKNRVTEVRALLRTAEKADAAAQLTERSLADADAELATRLTARSTAEAGLETELQRLSDLLEGWARRLADQIGNGAGPEVPPAALRQSWLAAVTATAASSNPGAVLRGRIQSGWLTPAVTPLNEEAALAEDRAGQLTDEATTADREADAEQSRPEPEPVAPTRWKRRIRPAPSATGAPLWRVLDPVPELPQRTLDHIEAALDACGLLDAWVASDGAWIPQRDGDDTVLIAAADLPPAVGESLESVLQVAADAGELGGCVTALLARIAWQPVSGGADSAELPSGGYAVAVDGRWRTPITAGRAAPAPHGAELLGTAARTAARARRVEQLREQARRWRAEAAERRTHAARLRGRTTVLVQAADVAPDDRAVITAAHARSTARTEADRAQERRDRADAANRKAATARDNAHASLLQTAASHRLPHTESGLDDTAARLDTLISHLNAWQAALTKEDDAARWLTGAERDLAEALAEETAAKTASDQAQRQADEDAYRVEAAREALSGEHTEVLARETQLKADREALLGRIEELGKALSQLRAAVAKAEQHLQQSTVKRQAAEVDRDKAAVAWWVLVDTRLPELRGVHLAGGRTTRSALETARIARDKLRPPRWSSDPDIAAKDRVVADAWTALVTRHLPELRLILEASGGRTVVTNTREETGSLESVLVRVDATSDATDPMTAIERLTRQIQDLATLHDEKMNAVLVELLSSTFVEHLRDRLTTVIALLSRVNKVLAAHPTGATRTVLRLRRVPAENQKEGYAVLEALSGNVLGDAGVQEQVRGYLKQQIMEAQDRGRDSAVDWKDHLAQLLDYRTWFSVTTEYKVEQGADRWHPLTKEVHGRDSGGGKVVTLLQPLLATLVALYDESQIAPRPLWLDEAFTGVDAPNRATMLDLVVSFDLDFLLAGPDTVAATAQVPTAAIWHVNRAPAPLPGVDLSLTLWAGNMQHALTLPDLMQVSAGRTTRPATPALADEPALFEPDALTGSSA